MFCVLLWIGHGRIAASQDIRFLLNNEPLSISGLEVASELDSLDVSVDRILSALYRRGFHFARLDSLSTGTSHEADSGVSTDAHLSTGQVVTLGSIHLNYTGVRPPADPSFELGPGDPLNLDALALDIQRFLNRLGEEGRHMAIVELDSLVSLGNAKTVYDLYLSIDIGPQVPVTALFLDGATRTSASFAANEAELTFGQPIAGSELPRLTPRLIGSGLFSAVGEPVLEVYADSTAAVRIPVTEAPPGTFDLVLGYLPAGARVTSGQLVGSGHLNLLSPFGTGRIIGLRLERRPAQVSSVDVKVSDPQVAGLPVQLSAEFRGLQQDSTFNRRSLTFEVGYRLLRGVHVASSFSRESASPGSAGLALVSRKQRIPRSETNFWGLRIRLARVDNPFNPRSGVLLESIIERGNKQENTRIVGAGGDTTRVAQSFRQERLRLSGKAFIPTFIAQTVVVGADASVLLSDSQDESDLFRFGGTNSLRGYDEDQFLASAAIRLLFEYRLLLEARSFTFIFVDVGYVEAPGFGAIPDSSGWHPGFGIGMQFLTAAGLVSASYALNNDDGITNGRVHLGITFGL